MSFVITSTISVAEIKLKHKNPINKLNLADIVNKSVIFILWQVKRLNLSKWNLSSIYMYKSHKLNITCEFHRYNTNEMFTFNILLVIVLFFIWSLWIEFSFRNNFIMSIRYWGSIHTFFVNWMNAFIYSWLLINFAWLLTLVEHIFANSFSFLSINMSAYAYSWKAKKSFQTWGALTQNCGWHTYDKVKIENRIEVTNSNYLVYSVCFEERNK